MSTLSIFTGSVGVAEGVVIAYIAVLVLATIHGIASRYHRIYLSEDSLPEAIKEDLLMVGWLLKNIHRPRTFVAALVTAWLGIVLIDAIDVVQSDSSKTGNPPPEISSTKKMDLYMPTEYPSRRDTRKWPGFFGHKFPLGGQL